MALIFTKALKLFLSFCTVNMAASFGRMNTRRRCTMSTVRHLHSRWGFAHPSFVSTPTHNSISHQLNMIKSATNYSQSATSLAQLSTDSNQAYPDWWPKDATAQNCIVLMDHIAHVVVPDVTTLKSGGETLSCEELLQLVLDTASQNYESKSSASDDKGSRQMRLDEWREGEIVSNSTHVLDPGYRHDPSTLPEPAYNKANLNTMELLALGSVWYLPISAAPPNIDRFDTSKGIKSRRLNTGDYNITLYEGDYLRVHFDPRRFCETNKWNWGCKRGTVDGKPGVIVARDDEAGYMIIDKPSNVPVHARVDNLLENVAASVGRSIWMEKKNELALATSSDESTQVQQLGVMKRNKRKQKTEQLIYVATPQRLDQNTTGLLVVATKKSFAAYFAKLLRTKTSGQLRRWKGDTLGDAASSSCGIHKSYKCLVCIMQSPSKSMAATVEDLQSYSRDSTVIRHYLEPSIKSRKLFHKEIPKGVENPDSWAECLLRITSVSETSTVIGNRPSEDLAKALWGEYGKPQQCIGVVELEVELLTGRTHQIRGQFAALGYPLYGGAIPLSSMHPKKASGSFFESERLALQCSSLQFLNPLVSEDHPGASSEMRRSDHWLSFSLEQAFWSPHLEQYKKDTTKLSPPDATSPIISDTSLLVEASNHQPQEVRIENDLPPRVSLSKGSHKYVMIKASGTSLEGEVLFVRSASPEECNGPYHANVAENLLIQLRGLGCHASVIGGGRIDYIETDEISHAHVNGFSFSFGKGDHQLVADVIESNTDIVTTFDNNDGLY